MSGRSIRDLMTRHPICCTPDESVVECARVMEQHDLGMLPVVESRETRRLLGVITDRDLCLEVIAGGLNPNDVTVEECMTDELYTVREGDTVERALEVMDEERLRRLPVIDDHGALVGILTHHDVEPVVEEHSPHPR